MLSTLTSKLRPTVLAVSLFALAASAQATTVTFGTGGTAGFTNGGNSDGPISVGGVWLTVTPWTEYGDSELTASSGGYGVESEADRRDDPQIDGDGPNEAIILTFSSAVSLNSVTTTSLTGGESTLRYGPGYWHRVQNRHE